MTRNFMTQTSMSDEAFFKLIVVVVILIVISIGGNWDTFRSDRVRRLYENLVAPHSGEKDVLPERVLFIIEFMRMNQIKTFSMSRAIADDRFTAQPLTEGAYPIIVMDSADVFVSYSRELTPIGCATLTSGKGITIADCR